ncbi:MAG: hypothetical protein HQL97_12655 [Magnetococcales bacterium]|nr:hypothetical protein [Magnetococcales bacterium]
MSQRRFKISIGLGALFGLLCAWLAGQQQPELFSPTNPIFWSIFTDRLLIGMMIGFAGAFTRHPVLGFPYRPWLRGGCLGLVVSLPLAAGAMSGPPHPHASAWMIFWASLLTGAVYGLIIDLVATRFGGEGIDLIHTSRP